MHMTLSTPRCYKKDFKRRALLQHNKRKSSRTSIEYRTKKRYFRELAAIKAELGDASDFSEDEIYPGEDLYLHDNLLLKFWVNLYDMDALRKLYKN